MDFKAIMQYGFDTYKLHDRDIQPNNFWQTWHTAVYDLANRTLRLNIQEDYTKHYDFKLAATATQKAPDYSQKASWYKLPEITKDVDTFYINSTAYIMGSFEEEAPDYATLDNAEMLAGFAGEYMAHATVYEDCTNVFMPYYRQAGLRYAGEVYKNTGNSDSALLGMPYDDITSALDYYFKNYNNGRPFIIAGHSQGSAIARLVLKKYFKEHPEYYERMIAAYVIGYSVTKDDLKAYPHLKFATGESDTGVIVSWNTEGPKNVETNANNVVVLPGTMSINPLNWKLDETYAPTSENLGSLVANEKTGEYEIGDIGADAKINLARGVVVTNAEVEPIPEEAAKLFAEFFGPDGRHNNDYTYYYNNIKANVAKRIAAYKAIVQEQARNKKITDGNYDKSLAVKCINGTFVGKKAENIITYKGIPFVSRQPVGGLRWKAPVDFIPDDGVYEAYYNAKAACQNE